MLLSETVKVKWNRNNKKWYEERGYIFTKCFTEFEIETKDLMNKSSVMVMVKCDNCDKILENIHWYDYKKCVREDDKYYCRSCVSKLFGGKNIAKTLLNKNGKSFEQWCIENNRQDVLNRWDYELNDCNPSGVCYGTNKKYYIKCPKNLHKSELKNIRDFAKGIEGVMYCKQCLSFAQFGIDNISKDFLEKYWDYEKNNELGIDPWSVGYGSGKKVFIKCQLEKNHKSYLVSCHSFNSSNSRCPKCQNSKGEERIIKYLQKNKREFIFQKEFDGLIGLGNGNLSYDFYLPQYNLFVEYQGEQHEKYIKGFHKSKKDFERQVEHDKRKREYANKNNIKLLEVWYWDFDNIENILNKELYNKNSNKAS